MMTAMAGLALAIPCGWREEKDAADRAVAASLCLPEEEDREMPVSLRREGQDDTGGASS